MSTLNEYLSKIEDEDLREKIKREVNKLTKQKKFGLVFEEHLPECTPLYDIPVKKGAKVSLKDGEISNLYKVLKIEEQKAFCVSIKTKETFEFDINNLVVTAEFGEAIYPYLKQLDSICNAPDSNLWHTLIEADNYHALQLLEYLYAGKVDCIYIDPPYNTGAKDWKYNNDYVDGNDSYRHSKWLSMMDKRLKIAKKLLNPNDSVLIVTIDEKEYLHLGCLLEELFPEANIQMVSSVISPRGAMRKDTFTRVDEYLFFVFMGKATIYPFGPDMLQYTEYANVDVKVWAQLIRGSSNGPRTKRPNLFYPIFFNKETGRYMGVGEPLPLTKDRNEVEIPDGCFAVFPIRRDGLEETWALQVETFKEKIKKGYIKFGKWNKGETVRSLAHLQTGTMSRIENGEIETFGKDEEGTIILGNTAKGKRPASVWNMQSHDAGSQGKNLLTKMLPYCDFSFPKSLYAVRDTLKFIVGDKKDALIVDFFAGSGTTLHAVNLINAEDGGNRQCIMITNNEVSEAEARTLSMEGCKPGDEKWENLGIARYVTWPRTVCSIKGENIKGEALKGDYIGSVISMSEGFKSNANFFKLGFLDKTRVSLRMQFKEMLPTLWMKAGTIGKCPELQGRSIPDMLILPENKMAILNDENQFAVFKKQLKEYPEIKVVYLVTDYEGSFTSMSDELKGKVTYQLYRDYLDNFRINAEKNSRN